MRAYTYDRGFLHAKTCVVDGEACTVGTANWDVRSFKLNFETNAFIYDRRVCGRALFAPSSVTSSTAPN